MRPLQIIRLIQPKCSRTFGTSPCLATGSKCWNTDASCKYRAALNLTLTVTLDFVREGYTDWQATGYQPAMAIPALVSYDISPTVLNVAGGNENAGPLGLRGVLQATFKDFADNDVLTDPYPSSRSYDPLLQGSFWSKWLVRNPFHVGYVIEVYEGFAGDDLSAMTKRTFSVERIDRTRDQVQVTAKDILRIITDTGVTAPVLSTGQLASAITTGSTSLVIAGAKAADYPAPGWVRINSEVISFLTTTGASDVTLGGLGRGAEGTTVASHSQGERVQSVISYDDVRCDAIIDDLLTRGGIVGYRDLAAWTAEVDEWRPEFTFKAMITEPTKVETLIGEVLQQAMLHMWWDERTQLIRLKSQAPAASPVLITDADDIVRGSCSEREFPERRAADVRVYYGLRTPVSNLSDPISYASGVDRIDVTKIMQYGGEAPVKEIFCRWVQSSAIASTLAQAYGNRFADVRREITFDVTTDSVWTGDLVTVRHFSSVNMDGSARNGTWLVTQAEPISAGARYRLVAEDSDMVGKLWSWVDDAVPDWASASANDKATVGYWLTNDDLDLDGNTQPWRWL